jgi:hypothetical protein
MKKSISILTIGLMIATSGTGQYNNNASLKPYIDPVIKENSIALEIGRSKAKKNFQKLNKQAEAVEWFDLADGFAAYYLTTEGIKAKTFFNSKGWFLWSILNYGEKNLPNDIRIQVKSVYFLDYRITNVSEIQHHSEQGTIYLVQITNDKVWKKLRIHDGEMEVIEEFPAL